MQRGGSAQLERSKEEIQVEETLVFDFLHGLGRSVSRNHPAARSASADRRGRGANSRCPWRRALSGRSHRDEACAGLSFQRLSAAGRSAARHFAAGRQPRRSRSRVFSALHTSMRAKVARHASGKAAQPVYLTECRTAAGAGEAARNRARHRFGHGDAACFTANKTWACSRSPTARWARPLRRAISSSSNRSPSNPPSRSTTPSSIRKRTKRSDSITTWRSRATSSAFFSRHKRRPIAGFEIAGMNIPARQVSGDYFDYIRVDEDRLGVAIADVSGKGVPASLIMAICRSVLRSQAPADSVAGRGFAEGQSPALSRHQRGHVHQHGLPHSRS